MNRYQIEWTCTSPERHVEYGRKTWREVYALTAEDALVVARFQKPCSYPLYTITGIRAIDKMGRTW